jgi:hypothetical protein
MAETQDVQCVYCGATVYAFTADRDPTAQLLECQQVAQEHDQGCERNPLVQQVRALSALLFQLQRPVDLEAAVEVTVVCTLGALPRVQAALVPFVAYIRQEIRTQELFPMGTRARRLELVPKE